MMASPRLFIGGLKNSVSREAMEREFQEFGELIETWIAKDPPGFAFVEFATCEQAGAALKAKNKTMCFGGEIRVEFTKKRGSSKRGHDNNEGPVPRLFVGNIKSEVEKDDVGEIFAKHGKLTDVWIARNPTGFAFVEYETMDMANEAVQHLDGTEHFGGRIRVELTEGRRERRRKRVDSRGEKSRDMRRAPYDRPPPADDRRRDPYPDYYPVSFSSRDPHRAPSPPSYREPSRSASNHDERRPINSYGVNPYAAVQSYYDAYYNATKGLPVPNPYGSRAPMISGTFIDPYRGASPYVPSSKDPRDIADPYGVDPYARRAAAVAYASYHSPRAEPTYHRSYY